MPNADYFRQQAERCTRLARMCADVAVAERLRAMASEFMEQAEQISPDPSFTHPAVSQNGAGSNR